MATNRGAYDPRQFLHYPDKNPFSDESQKRLDDLVNDFLRTGIAFANGASVHDLTAETDIYITTPPRHLNGLTELEPSLEAIADGDAVEDEDDELEEGYLRIDKGKGRDELEGPGVEGLWAQTNALPSSASPTQGITADDAISLSSGSEVGGVTAEDAGLEDGDVSYGEESYDDGVAGEAIREYEHDGDLGEESETGTEPEPLNSRVPSSEQEIIFIGDSDEDEPKSRALSELEAEGFRSHSDVEAQDDDPEIEYGSGLDAVEEQGAPPDLWRASNGQDEEDHSYGKESDEDEGRPFDHREIDYEEPHMHEAGANANATARNFFTSASLTNPWSSPDVEDVSKSSVPGLTGLENHYEKPDIESKANEQGESQESGEAPDASKSFTLVSREMPQPEAKTPVMVEVSHRQPSISSSVVITPLSDPTPTANLHDSVLVPDNAAHPLVGDKANSIFRFSTPPEPIPARYDGIPPPDVGASMESFFPSHGVPSIFAAIEDDATNSSSVTYPTLMPPSTVPTEQLPLFDAIPPAGFPMVDIHQPRDSGGIYPSAPDVESGNRSGSNLQSITQTGLAEQLLFEDSTAPPGLLTESTLHDAYFRVMDGSHEQVGQASTNIETTVGDGQAGSSNSRQYPSSDTNAQRTEDSSGTFKEAQSEFGHDQPAPEIFPEVAEEPSLLAEQRDEDSDYDHHFALTTLRSATFDHQDGYPADMECRSPTPSPMAKTGSPSSGFESHSVINVDLHSNEVAKESYTVAEVLSESGGDIGGQGSGASNAEDSSRDYSVEELAPHGGRDIDGPSGRDTPISGRGELDHLERSTHPGQIPAISVGSGSPPLSPTATVTNCSSVPDASIATSDLSTANHATVSVVTSTSSPPPIHVSRPSPIPADIRQPQGTRVGFASDEDQEDENTFPDPSLPPEPTHLRIPVGVVSRGLADNKEEKAESIKVEPPTPHVEDESEDGRMSDVGERPDGETPLPGAQLEFDTKKREGSESSDLFEARVETVQESQLDPIDGMVSIDIVRVDSDREATTSVLGLTYPDSDSGPSNGRGGSGSLADHPFEGGKLTISPQPAHEDQRHSNPPSPSPESVHPPIPQDDQSSTSPLNGSPEFHADTTAAEPNSHPITPDGIVTKDRPADDSKEPMHPKVAPVATVVGENGSSVRRKHSPRISAKGKAKVMSPDIEPESPTPLATIRVQGRASASPRKRIRGSDVTFEPSKQRRLTRSTAARNSSLSSIGDGASSSGVSDDRSDASSIASSSSLVSRILRSTSSKPSSFVTVRSRSSSIVSQTSPSSAMAPPIRPYVPHNHSYHSQAPAIPSTAPRRRTTPTSQRSLSASPSPSVVSQPTSTHQTRASCTDHKISIPGPDGSLLYFLIPRCSLLEPEVEKDDSIVDCGVATREEVKWAVGDLEAIGLDSEILGAIRQLAGVQLMREHQVGYLPKPGERIRRRGKQRRSHIPPPSLTQDAAPQVDPSGPSGAGSSHLAPLEQESTASPASSSGSPFSEAKKNGDVNGHKGRRSKALKSDRMVKDPTPDAEGDDDEDEGEGEDNEPEEETVIPPSSSPKSVRLERPNRSRRRGLRTDDAAYKPENDEAGSSSGVESPGSKKKPKGIKRRRSEGSALGEPTPEGAVESIETSPKKKRKRRGAKKLEHQEEPRQDDSESPHKTNRRKTGPQKSDS